MSSVKIIMGTVLLLTVGLVSVMMATGWQESAPSVAGSSKNATTVTHATVKNTSNTSFDTTDPATTTTTSTTTTTMTASAESTNSKTSATSSAAPSTTKTIASTTSQRINTPASTNSASADENAPDKNKRRLLFDLEGKTVEFSFDKVVPYSENDQHLLWQYVGTTASGLPVICKVSAERGTICEIAYDVEFDSIVIPEADARACMKQFLKEQSLSVDADSISLSKEEFTARGTADTPPQKVVYWSFFLPTEKEHDYLSCFIRSKDGKLYIKHVYIGNTENVDGQIYSLPYLLGDDPDWILPRWKNE